MVQLEYVCWYNVANHVSSISSQSSVCLNVFIAQCNQFSLFRFCTALDPTKCQLCFKYTVEYENLKYHLLNSARLS